MATEKGKKSAKPTQKKSFWQSLKSFLTDRRTHIALGVLICVCVLYLAISMIFDNSGVALPFSHF